MLAGVISTALLATEKLYYVGDASDRLYCMLQSSSMEVELLSGLDLQQVENLPRNASLLIVADGYPDEKTHFSREQYQAISKKSIRLYIEYPEVFPGNLETHEEVRIGNLERGVVTSDFFMPELPPLSIVSVNGCRYIPVKHPAPDLVFAKVAGFDKAEYGLAATQSYPLLIRDKNKLIATTSLSNCLQGRYGPDRSWKTIWETICRWLTRDPDLVLTGWAPDPHPAYSRAEPLKSGARASAIKEGANWFFKSRLLLHPSWKAVWQKYQSDGTSPYGPPVDAKMLTGDGGMGILEGHASTIYFDGTQRYRYWLRSDVQGEVAFALAAAGKLLGNNIFLQTSEKITDFLFYTSKARELSNDPAKDAYGLLGWADTHPHVIYGDDNARATLGIIGASAFMQNERWNRFIVENILANFRTSGKYGFRGSWTDANGISQKGWKQFASREIKNPHPHFESWLWACYLWLYDKTGYAPLLEKAREAITITMEAYPDNWKWTNGIQQERARMILPLAWLVRVEDTPEHRQWLMALTDDLLRYQESNGAIREELGDASSGRYGRTKSNADYGTTEAPLIFRNGDKVADMLYTSNFAFFALNEAAQATGMAQYRNAAEKLSEFLIRIQVKSELHPDLDGAWFRAFDYGRWDYWGSNADVGWGAWCTLSGWIQSWIVGTQVLMEEKQSFWEATHQLNVKKEFEESLWMLN